MISPLHRDKWKAYLRLTIGGTLGFLASFSAFWIVVVFGDRMIGPDGPYIHFPSLMPSFGFALIGAIIGSIAGRYMKPFRRTMISRSISRKPHF